MPDRPKTNSITHLVKIVAKEVLEDRLPKSYGLARDHEERLSQLEEFWKKPLLDTKFLTELESDLENAGGPWYPNEDRKLEAEVDVILRFLAKKHSRTVGAIKARIKGRELII